MDAARRRAAVGVLAGTIVIPLIAGLATPASGSGLSDAHRDDRVSLRRGRDEQPARPSHRIAARTAVRKVLRHREPAGRWHHHRRALGRPRAAGRLHAAGCGQCDDGDQCHAVQKTALRPDRRFALRTHSQIYEVLVVTPPATAFTCRHCAAGQGPNAGRPHLRLIRPRHRAAHQWRVAEARAWCRGRLIPIAGTCPGPEQRRRRPHHVRCCTNIPIATPLINAGKLRPIGSPWRTASRPCLMCLRLTRSACRVSTMRPGSCFSPGENAARDRRQAWRGHPRGDPRPRDPRRIGAPRRADRSRR